MAADTADQVEDILAALDVVMAPGKMAHSCFQLHPLASDRKGQEAGSVGVGWRIDF